MSKIVYNKKHKRTRIGMFGKWHVWREDHPNSFLIKEINAATGFIVGMDGLRDICEASKDALEKLKWHSIQVIGSGMFPGNTYYVDGVKVSLEEFRKMFPGVNPSWVGETKEPGLVHFALPLGPNEKIAYSIPAGRKLGDCVDLTEKGK